MKASGAEDRHLNGGDLRRTTERLTRWAAAHYGPGAIVDQVAPMPGHAGISFGFDVTAGTTAERLVIRVAPPGVRRAGNTDVLHQVPVLRCAKLHGVPVPDVRWWGDDERWFGSPYFVVERLAGSSVNSWGPVATAPATARDIFDQAVTALADIHRIDWARRLPGWSTPRTLDQEIAAWKPILEKGQNPEWTERAMRLHDLLLRHRPAEPSPAIVHGDFYSNNWVTAGNRLLGIVDWEIACVGPPLLDVGWLMLVYDPQSWAPARQAVMDWAPPPAQIAAAYALATSHEPSDLGWYRALAAWRLASITALNVRLHRSGKRPDTLWDEIADSFEPMVDRGLELVLSREAAAL